MQNNAISSSRITLSKIDKLCISCLQGNCTLLRNLKTHHMLQVNYKTKEIDTLIFPKQTKSLVYITHYNYQKANGISNLVCFILTSNIFNLTANTFKSKRKVG